MKTLRIIVYSVVLATINVGAVLIGLPIYKWLHHEFARQIPISPLLCILAFSLWRFFANYFQIHPLRIQKSSEWRWIYVIAFMWSPLIFIPLHSFRWEYVASFEDIVAIWSFQSVVNIPSIFGLRILGVPANGIKLFADPSGVKWSKRPIRDDSMEMPQHIKRHNDIIKNAVVLLVTISAGLLLCEFILRYLWHAWPFKSPLYTPEYLTERDQYLRWRFSPTDGRNNLGLRNRKIGTKQPGCYRILFLGDSLIWSGETSSGELYTEVLEQRLNARFSNENHFFEIINAGVPGYTTYQELEFLRLYGFEMQPDMLILGFVFNDLHYKYLHRPTSRHNILDIEPDARLHRFDSRTFPGIIFGRSYLAHEIVNRIDILWKRLHNRPIFAFEQKVTFYLAWKEYGWHRTQQLLENMHALLRENAIVFAIVVFPISDQVNKQHRQVNEAYVLYPQSQITRICQENSIPMFDLTDALYENGGTTLFSDYLHLNSKGNDVVTNELERFLITTLELNIKYRSYYSDIDQSPYQFNEVLEHRHQN